MSVSKKCRMSGNCSTICGAGASKICTKGEKPTMCSKGVPLDPLLRPRFSREPRAGPPRYLRHSVPSCFGLLSPKSSVRSLSVFCAGRPSYFSPAATMSNLWWAAAGRAIATLCCSCLHHKRRRRCLLRHAEPWSPCSIMSTTGHDRTVTQKETRTPVEPVVVVVFVVVEWLNGYIILKE